MEKESFFKIIRSNIEESGYHLNIVSSPTEPRYAYSIGLNEKFGIELMLAGGLYYHKKNLFEIFNYIVNQLENRRNELPDSHFNTDLGDFSLTKVHPSWSVLMGLGAFDYYQNQDIAFLQILPDKEHFTMEIPNMSVERSHDTDPIWKWLDKDWDLPVPLSSTVATNIEVLRGDTVTELMRWEEDEWEMFSIPGTDVEPVNTRIVSIATLIGMDSSLERTLSLKIGKGLWRENSQSPWNDWG